MGQPSIFHRGFSGEITCIFLAPLIQNREREAQNLSTIKKWELIRFNHEEWVSNWIQLGYFFRDNNNNSGPAGCWVAYVWLKYVYIYNISSEIGDGL